MGNKTDAKTFDVLLGKCKDIIGSECNAVKVQAKANCVKDEIYLMAEDSNGKCVSYETGVDLDQLTYRLREAILRESGYVAEYAARFFTLEGYEASSFFRRLQSGQEV